ncbi:DUF1351 domain-containing protein [Faecalibacillus faecis]|uniref:DUF1351 domain-containing protein n=1 Tax=Faecalibacillus faecis TaxID=1982628 RepID=UPI0022DE97A2|nr:DUF1351 domain-containing protein [Faecalibacillus faecis]
MDKLKLFIDGKIAVITYQEEEFNHIKEYLSINNMFLQNGEPVSKMKFSGVPSIVFVKQNIVHHKPFNEVNEETLSRCIKYQSVAKDIEDVVVPSVEEPAPQQQEEQPFTPAYDSQPIDAVVEEKEEVVHEVATDVQLKADAEVAEITSNIKEFKENVIPKIKERANLVITRDNIKFAKDEMAKLNKNKKLMKEDCSNLKLKILSNFNEYEKEIKEVEKVIDNVVATMKSSIIVFEEEDLKLRKKEKETYIHEQLDKAIQEGLPKEFAGRFEGNKKWWENKTYQVTKFKQEVEAEINRLKEAYDRLIKSHESIKSFIEVQCKSAGIEPLDSANYIKFLDNGSDIADVMNAVTRDIQNIQFNIERAKNKALEEQKAKEQQFVEQSQNVAPRSVISNTEVSKQDKEVAQEEIQSDAPRIIQSLAETPKGHEGDKYEYTFRIAGDFGTVKTVSEFLSKLTEYGLRYEKLSGGKVNNG